MDSFEVVVNYNHLNSKIELKGIQSIYKFIYSQVKEWNKLENIPNYFVRSKTHFEELKSNLIRISSTNDNSIHDINRELNDFKVKISNSKTNYDTFVFIYDAPETDFLLSIYKKETSLFDGALDYLTKGNKNINNDFLTGQLYAYEFKNQENSEILQRRNNEKLSLNHIRSKFNEYIVEAEQQLNKYIDEARENLGSHFVSIDELKDEKKNNYDTWFQNTERDFNSFFDKAQNNITTHEDLYREKLRLEAPAEYWKKRAEKLKKESSKYMNWLIGICVVSALLLFSLLMTLGTNFFETAFSDSIKGIKWSIILITLVSFLAYALKILAKLTFSSLHLSRDSEEKEQLTHFYLALKKDTSIEPEERQLILQSLFSRADTGLLKEDSSPTMPTNIVDKFNNSK